MPKVLRPQFEQFLHELGKGKALPINLVSQYRAKVMALIEAIPELIVNKGSVTGHADMRLDFNCTWLGPNWSQDQIISALLERFSGNVFPADSREAHVAELEDEAVVFRFAVQTPEGYLAGRVRVLPS
jgi:hypothetical protein